MNPTQPICISPTAFTETVDNEMIILDIHSENYFALDAIGTVMWEQLRTHASIDALSSYMLAHYEVEASVLTHDIEIFIETLLDKGLITLGEI